MGCEGLQYCSNYNSRPTELFRSCSAQADRAARGDVQLWGQGTIRLPLMDDIPVKGKYLFLGTILCSVQAM